MSYFCMEDDEVHPVMDGKSIRNAQLNTAMDELTFELRLPSSDARSVFLCENKEDYVGWIAAIKEANSGSALSMNFGQHLQHLRVNKLIKKMDKTDSRTPVFQDKLFKLRPGGDRMVADDWLEYQAWLARNGSIRFWQHEEDCEATLCTPREIRTAVFKKTAASVQSPKQWAFQMLAAGQPDVSSEFAATSKAARDVWLREIRERQQELGVLAPVKEYTVKADVKRLGMEFTSGPPEAPAIVGVVKVGNWAHSVGIMPGDEIAEVNQVGVKEMAFSEFMSMLQQRPLKLGIALPKEAGSDLSASEDSVAKLKFQKSNTLHLRKKAAPKKKMSKFIAKKPVPAG